MAQNATSSRCVVERAVVHNFEITNCSLLEGMGVDKYVASSTFSAGGYDWNVRFYPDGDKKETTGYYGSAFLFCLSMQDKDSVRAKFTLVMLDDQGNAQQVHRDHAMVNTFTPESAGYGLPKFFEKSKLKSLPHLENSTGCITIRCDLVVIKEPPPTECKKTDLAVIPTAAPELPGHLESALKNGRGADITLLVGDREFRANRFLLAARSPVFGAQLFGPMMEKDHAQHIEVDDMEPAIFEMLLHFIYTESLLPCNDEEEEEDHDVATMQHLLVAADRYGMDGLKVMCEDKLCKSIGVKTVTAILALANRHFCQRLEEACVEFMSRPGVAAVVLLSEGFKGLIARFPLLDLGKRHRDKEGRAKCQEEEVS